MVPTKIAAVRVFAQLILRLNCAIVTRAWEVPLAMYVIPPAMDKLVP